MINSAWISLILVLAGVLYIIWKLRLKNGISFQAALAVLIAAVFAGLVIIDYQFAYGEYKAAYPIVIAVSVIIVIVSLIFFKKKKWL